MKLITYQIFIFCILCSCGQSHNQSEEKDAFNPELRLEKLGIQLPEISQPLANYTHLTQAGNILYLAGKGPRDYDGNLISGCLGKDMTVEEGYEAARNVGISQIAVLKDHLGELSRVKKILKVNGFVRCDSSFTQQPEVINGYSDLMVEVFGERGKHARAALGMNALPRGIPVEIDMVVLVESRK